MAQPASSPSEPFGAKIKGALTRHAVPITAVLSVLVVVFIISTAALAHKKKSNFVTAHNNMQLGQNNPLWHLGAQDAGAWGPVHRDVTPAQAGVWNPHHRFSTKKHLARQQRRALRARFTDGGGKQPACEEGKVLVANEDGTYSCLTQEEAWGDASDDDDDGAWDPAACGKGWDPAAVAEAQALTSLGAARPSASASEGRLHRALATAHDTSRGMSEDQLGTLMHNGGAP